MQYMKCCIIIHPYKLTLFLSSAMIEPIATQSYGILVQGNSSVIQLLMYYTITLILNYKNHQQFLKIGINRYLQGSSETKLYKQKKNYKNCFLISRLFIVQKIP